MRIFCAAAVGLALFSLSAPSRAAPKPDAVAAHREGMELVRQNALDRAIPRLERAVQLDAEFTEAWVDLGNARVTAGDPGSAIPAFEMALKQQPDLEIARYNLAYSLRRTNQHPRAAEQYRLFLQSRPDDADARYGLATSLEAGGQWAAAADAYEAYAEAEKRPQQAAFVAKARAQAAALRKKAGPASAPVAPTAVAVSPAPVARPASPEVARPPADGKGGLHLSFSGAGKPAVEASAAVDAAPSPAARAPKPLRSEAFQAGMTRLQEGDYEGALARLEVAVREAPTDPFVLAAVGSANLGLLRGEAAEMAYQQSIVSAEKAALAALYLGLGEALRLQGETERARASYAQARDHSSASATVKRLAEERLAALGG